MKAGGGAEGWASVKYLRFTFVVEKDGAVRASRTHYWDRMQERHRLETTDKDGAKVICLTHLPSREGVCAVGDGFLFEADAKPYLDRAYEAWINDTYWLLMPYKMKDPGVQLRYDGEAKDAGRIYDKVLLTFDRVGLTPKDRYWAFVDRKTHRMDKWAYVLQDDKGQPGTGDPTPWAWKGWARYGGLMLASERVSADGKTRILFKDLAVYDSLPDVVFSKTSKVELPPQSAGSR